MNDLERLDLVIIGGGIGGVICLKYAKDAGLHAVLIERSGAVGGIWRDLPAWQDIQFPKEDWTLGDLPIAGEDQASICANIQAWVDRFQLSSLIHLNANVTSARYAADGWQVSTAARSYHCRHLVAATGGHNRAYIPQVERTRPGVREFHSSKFKDPGELTGRDIVVVGGGASAYDLLDLCFQHNARRVVWVYRSTKWMRPTRKQKHYATDVRMLGRQQMLGISVAKTNQLVNQDLRVRYRKAGLEEIIPDYELDLRHHQLIPGRRDMINNFNRIERHRGVISRIDNGTVHLSDGQRVDVQLILWGTGYELDLTYFDIPTLSRLTRLEDLGRRCGALFRSLDAPNLFFLAPNVLEVNTCTPWAYAHASKSIVSDIRGNEVFDVETVADYVNYFDLAKFLARRDRANYTPGLWYLKYLNMALLHPKKASMPIP
ncbi:MAG: NAD(P)/FAD-dependent oxidoreductase [Burkholderiales bacterium]|nr:NAD(P)/FAD-dependent oxidoreductase [Burkholderiales bacterium]